MRGPAPKLKAATGGRARVHRYESSEHQDAVDGTLRRLSASSDPDQVETGEQAAGLLDPSKPITIGQGESAVELTPGEITALMGDFYGVYDENGVFNAGASFQQLMTASPNELKGLQGLLARERRGHEIMPGEWEKVLEGREGKTFDYTDPVTGETKTFEQLGYLDMAARNDNHFSGPTMSGTDNNMGTYTAFHEMALQEAQRLATNGANMSAEEKQAALNNLRAMESCAMHYLTDRHAGGHNFQKQGVMDASGYNETGPFSQWDWPAAASAMDAWQGEGTTANLFVKTVHDEWNAGGVEVSDGDGESWVARGDGHWNDDENEENRLRTAESVGTSWAELQSVIDGKVDPATLKETGYAAYNTVPQWSDDNQAAAEKSAEDHYFAEVAGGLGWDYGTSYGEHYFEEWVTDPIQNFKDQMSYEMWLFEQSLINQAMYPYGF